MIYLDFLLHWQNEVPMEFRIDHRKESIIWDFSISKIDWSIDTEQIHRIVEYFHKFVNIEVEGKRRKNMFEQQDFFLMNYWKSSSINVGSVKTKEFLSYWCCHFLCQKIEQRKLLLIHVQVGEFDQSKNEMKSNIVLTKIKRPGNLPNVLILGNFRFWTFSHHENEDHY